LKSSYGWRSVYFVGILPLVILTFARRNLRETRRFEAQVGEGAARRPIAYILRTPYRKRVFQLGAIWFATYACSNTAVSFWKEFAVGDRHFTDGQVGLALTIAALGSMPLVFLAGKLLDVVGRRRGAVIVFVATSLSVFLAYGLEGRWPLTASLTVAIFGVSAVLPVLNAFTAELFPTDLRGDAFAWANNLIGRVGYVLAPIVVGALAEQWGWGLAVQPTAIMPLVALGLILWWMPETNQRELEQTASAVN
jgi:putative MFS transporter